VQVSATKKEFVVARRDSFHTCFLSLEFLRLFRTVPEGHRLARSAGKEVVDRDARLRGLDAGVR
jgi:hypothetical protein